MAGTIDEGAADGPGALPQDGVDALDGPRICRLSHWHLLQHGPQGPPGRRELGGRLGDGYLSREVPPTPWRHRFHMSQVGVYHGSSYSTHRLQGPYLWWFGGGGIPSKFFYSLGFRRSRFLRHSFDIFFRVWEGPDRGGCRRGGGHRRRRPRGRPTPSSSASSPSRRAPWHGPVLPDPGKGWARRRAPPKTGDRSLSIAAGFTWSHLGTHGTSIIPTPRYGVRIQIGAQLAGMRNRGQNGRERNR